MIECHIAPSPLGHLAYRAEDGCLTGLFFVGQKHFPAGLIDTGPPKSHAIVVAKEQIAEYFAGERTVFSVPLRLNGTEFQQRVWAALQEIPFGASWTYGDLARRMGVAAGASRAVGGANGRNPVGIIVPCHRVIGADGELTGYAGGVERKQHLLTLEGGTGTCATHVVLNALPGSLWKSIKTPAIATRLRGGGYASERLETMSIQDIKTHSMDYCVLTRISTRRFFARPRLCQNAWT